MSRDNQRENPYCLIQECSRASRALPHQNAPLAGSACQSWRERKTRFPVRLASLLSRPDLAPPEPRRKGEKLREKIDAQLAAIKQAPALVRSFFLAPSVAYITDW